jgi:hypothetical protein
MPSLRRQLSSQILDYLTIIIIGRRRARRS